MTIPLHTPRRWYVFRAGAPGFPMPGWHASTYDGTKGAWFPTWAEALALALHQATKTPTRIQVLRADLSAHARAVAAGFDGTVR